MTAKKSTPPPDDVYDHTVAYVAQDPDYDPLWGLPTIAPVQETAPVVVSADPKES